MYRWNAVDQAAGLQLYIISKKFKKQILKYVVGRCGLTR
jgi:hypothetical protein